MSDFKGFQKPSQNYSKLPHDLIDNLPEIDSLAELKVVLYILRHTWGFSEYDKPKKMTTDEFANGRKRKDGSRMDGGTGLAANSIRSGLEKAVEHGFITVEIDESDAARIEKWYCLNMSDDSNLESRSSNIDPRSSKVDHRTEKDTLERKEPYTENKKTDDLQGEYITSIETAIQADVPVTDEIIDGLKTQSAAIMAFESAFGITSSSWAGKWHSGKPEWTRLRKWLVGVWQERPTCFDEYVAFKKGDGKFFGLMDATQIARKPDDFYTSWDVFVRENKPQKPEEKLRML